MSQSVVDVRSTQSQNNAIVAKGLEKKVMMNDQALEILRGIDLEIKQGESLAILGRSGSGKTTLLGLLAGLDIPSTGSIELMGEPIVAMSEDERAQVRARYVGFVFQSFHLMPNLTALENVMLPLELKGDQAKEKAEQYLAQVGLQDRMGHFPPQLSGGEQQRVALARAFACSPEILFADEPTGNLDLETGREITQLMFDLNRQHDTTLVMVTHDESLADRCERCIYIESGRLVAGPGSATGHSKTAQG